MTALAEMATFRIGREEVTETQIRLALTVLVAAKKVASWFEVVKNAFLEIGKAVIQAAHSLVEAFTSFQQRWKEPPQKHYPNVTSIYEHRGRAR